MVDGVGKDSSTTKEKVWRVFNNRMHMGIEKETIDITHHRQVVVKGKRNVECLNHGRPKVISGSITRSKPNLLKCDQPKPNIEGGSFPLLSSGSLIRTKPINESATQNRPRLKSGV